LYLDDSSNSGLLDINAKVRQLKLQLLREHDTPLGLVHRRLPATDACPKLGQKLQPRSRK